MEAGACAPASFVECASAMSEFSAGKALEEATERHEIAERGSRTVPIAAAILAVFAAISSLIAHHNSTSALAVKNEAILSQNKSSDQYAYYESKRIKSHLYQAFLLAGVSHDAKANGEMKRIAAKEDADAKQIRSDAEKYANESETYSSQSERHMQVYETEEIAATLFEVGIVLVSLSALMTTPGFVYGGLGLSIVGLFFMIKGLFGH